MPIALTMLETPMFLTMARLRAYISRIVSLLDKMGKMLIDIMGNALLYIMRNVQLYTMRKNTPPPPPHI